MSQFTPRIFKRLWIRILDRHQHGEGNGDQINLMDNNSVRGQCQFSSAFRDLSVAVIHIGTIGITIESFSDKFQYLKEKPEVSVIIKR